MEERTCETMEQHNSRLAKQWTCNGPAEQREDQTVGEMNKLLSEFFC